MSGYRYPTRPVERTHKQRAGKNYQKYRPCLRLEFGHRCVYCRTSEAEVRPVRRYGAFEIDHFRPRSAFPHLAFKYSNLYWSCPECNRIKAQKWPSVEEVKAGYRFVDPCTDTPSDHFDVQGEQVIGKTLAGSYTIDEVQLNSVVHRRNRAERDVMVKRLAMLVRLAADDESRNIALALWEELKGAPWDADTRCLCTDVTSVVPHGS